MAAAPSQKHSRFGTPDDGHATASSSTSETPGHWDTLHVPLYDVPQFEFSNINTADYDFYLLPVSRSQTIALSAVAHVSRTSHAEVEAESESSPGLPAVDVSAPGWSTVQEDVEEMYWDGESPQEPSGELENTLDTSRSSAGVRLSPSGHEILLQQLVETAAKFVPSRFCDSKNGQESFPQEPVDDNSSAIGNESEIDVPAADTDTSLSSFRSRERKRDIRKPRSIAQRTLRAVLSQPPPKPQVAGAGCPSQPIDLFSPSPVTALAVENVRKENVVGQIPVTMDRARTVCTSGPIVTSQATTPIKVTPVQLQNIALMHFNLAHAGSPCGTSSSNSSVATSASSILRTPGCGVSVVCDSPLGSKGGAAGLTLYPPLDSWEDICRELKALETLRRDMMSMLSQSTSARSARACAQPVQCA
ncbi:hypothetical protein EUX98_g5950 [Antrodiella citrinella]|uniref:Uncharacterized protein n=1 Tax=Antrodiella citrinella TaxID=2447956 RepID=A0A4S4MQ78_9APHY|nr:hypothetical protein EUX98_g5950 [Antrodiella citrinella]